MDDEAQFSAEETQELRKRAFRENHVDEHLLSLSDARKYFEPLVTDHSQRLYHMTRLCHYCLFSDDRGTLDRGRNLKSFQHDDQLRKRYLEIQGFIYDFPEPEPDNPRYEVAEAAILFDTGLPSLGHLGRLIRAAWQLQEALREEDHCLWDIDEFNPYATEESTVSPGWVGKALSAKHGPGYLMYEAARSGTDTSLIVSAALAKLDGEHTGLLSDFLEENLRLANAARIHPVAFTKHLDLLEKSMIRKIRQTRERTKKAFGISRGRDKHNLSPNDEAKIHIWYLKRRRFGKSKKELSAKEINDRLLRRIPGADVIRRVSKLNVEFQQLHWAGEFLSEGLATDHEDIGLLYSDNLDYEVMIEGLRKIDGETQKT